jgi:AcrR family transcriptional regulator
MYVSGKSGGEGRRRRARGSLTRNEIAETALELLDRQGLEAVTMRQIAEALGVAVMSLYVHTRNKQELIQAAVDLVLAELPLADLEAEPRMAVAGFFETFHRKMLEHPSVAHTIASGPLLGPATFASMNSVFAVLEQAGLDDGESTSAMVAIMSYTLGFTLFSIARDHADPDLAEERQIRLRGLDPAQYSALHKVSSKLLEGTSDAQFTAGLTVLVEGFVPGRR